MGRVELVGAARLELVSGVARLWPEEAMFGAMLRGWRAQQKSRGPRDETAGRRYPAETGAPTPPTSAAAARRRNRPGQEISTRTRCPVPRGHVPDVLRPPDSG